MGKRKAVRRKHTGSSRKPQPQAEDEVQNSKRPLAFNPDEQRSGLASHPQASVHEPPPQPRSSALAVSLQEAAGLLGIHVNTVRREIWRGNLAAVRIGRIHRVRVAEIHAYLKRNESRRPSFME